ncbi:hypothetical protein JCM3766R1_003143 [Sporobolomyces carnicolor]
MSRPVRATPLPSERQLLHRAGGPANFKPGKGGAAGGETRDKVGSGWDRLVPSSSRLSASAAAPPPPDKVEIDDYEDDDDAPKINPARLAPQAGSNASRWAAAPHAIQRTSSQHSASASRQPKGPPSPSTSQTGTPRNGSPNTTTNGQRRGGTSTSRWATPASSAAPSQPRTPAPAATLNTPPQTSAARPQAAQTVNTSRPPPPPTTAARGAPRPSPRSAPPRPEPTLPAPDPPAVSPPEPVTVAVEVTSQSNELQQQDQQQQPHLARTTKPTIASAVPPAPVAARPPSKTTTASATPTVPTMPPTANANGPGGGGGGQGGAALNPRSLLPDRNRVATGGARKEKKSPEELEALMAAMRLKNEEAMKKRLKAEEDKKKFDEIAEAERKRSEELERKLREERERIVREEKERKQRTVELQREINRAREEAAQRKLALIEGRAWDAEKLERERDPFGEGGSGRELQYPSHERRFAAAADQERGDEADVRPGQGGGGGGGEVAISEEEARRRDGVTNDEQAWETVQHFEGKGRAQLVVK